MKVGDLVKWASSTNPNYYRDNHVGIVVRILPPDANWVTLAEVLIAGTGTVHRWHPKNVEVIHESR